jgi:hypothetical protein
MSVRKFAMILGIAFLLIGVLGFVPPLLIQREHGAHDELRVRAFEGYLLGLFHVNILHTLVHVLFGVMGIAMSRSYDTARLYARIVAVGYGLLTIMGLVPALNTVFGLIPIHGHDVWLHALIAAASAYFGFAAPADTEARTGPATNP